MYRYDEFDRQFVADRTAEFRDQVARRLNGKLTEDEFKPLRLMNGLYLQLHAYMLRVAIPYGTLDARQMRMLAHIAETWDKGYGHFTTRQNIQFNWPRLSDVPDMLDALASVDMHAIQTSGNCIRNTTSDPYAGVAPEEVEDPRITAELIRQWSSLHPEFTFLGRKFKIAVTGSSEDRTALKLHDIGVQIVRRDGEVGYRKVVLWNDEFLDNVREYVVAQTNGAAADFVFDLHSVNFMAPFLKHKYYNDRSNAPKQTKQNRAVVLLLHHPAWSDSQVAEHVPTTTKQLQRNTNYTALRSSRARQNAT